MVRWHNWKYFTYSGFDGEERLFDLSTDPEERKNPLAEYPEVAEKMRAAFAGFKTYDQVMEHENWVVSQLRLLMGCNFEDTEEHWQCPEDMEVLQNPIQRKEPFKPTALAAPRFLMGILTNDAELIPLGAEYIRAVAPSYLICGITQVYFALLKNTGYASRSSAISSSAVIMNIVLNATGFAISREMLRDALLTPNNNPDRLCLTG